MNKAIEILEEKVNAHEKALNSWQEELLRPDLKDSMRNFLTKQTQSIKEFISDLNDALSLLKAENTGVVSSAMHESSVYTDVRESHASGDTEQPQALVEGALEKITDTQEKIICPKAQRCAVVPGGCKCPKEPVICPL